MTKDDVIEVSPLEVYQEAAYREVVLRSLRDVEGRGEVRYHEARLFKLIDSLRAELNAERVKFQQETRRTSDLVTMLRRASDFICTSDGPPGGAARAVMVNQIGELLARPINA